MIMNIAEMRQYIRHPTEIPIESHVPDTAANDRSTMRNVSKSGLSFTSSSCVTPGSNIHLKIPLNDVVFEVGGIVMWCHDLEDFYEMGVKFTDDKAEYSMRMIEQLCHIEQYRQQVQEIEGREIDSVEAGREWTSKFAEKPQE